MSEGPGTDTTRAEGLGAVEVVAAGPGRAPYTAGVPNAGGQA